MTTPWNALVAHMQRVEHLGQVSALLAWDQQTQMPAQAAPGRGEQSALLASMVHEQLTDPRVTEWLNAVDPGTDPVMLAGKRNLEREIRRATAVPTALVARLAKLEADGFTAWVKAKETNDYGTFAPLLSELVSLTKEKAAAIDSDRGAYDVLLESYDPGTTVAQLTPLFARLRDGLTELLDAVSDRPDPGALTEEVPNEDQLAWHRTILERLGYDFDGGRMELAAHPFTIRVGARDVRITTRVAPNEILSGLGSSVHEGGHAMYEQGLPTLPGTGVAEAASMGLHESQSRFWENTIGRSKPFFDWAAPLLAARCPGAPTAEAMYAGANRIRPGLIRVEADEVTYNLHVIVRYELEQALFAGSLTVQDLPDAWNERYRALLGVEPTSYANGVLQDVHWSGGAFGYFPSYTLGNLYAASLGVAVQEAIGDLWQQVGRGDFSAVLGWLRENVHSKGHLLDSPDLMREIVGDRDHVEDLLGYLWGRHGAVYGVTRPKI
jgi:carboxypeptidase Taq